MKVIIEHKCKNCPVFSSEEHVVLFGSKHLKSQLPINFVYMNGFEYCKKCAMEVLKKRTHGI